MMTTSELSKGQNAHQAALIITAIDVTFGQFPWKYAMIPAGSSKMFKSNTELSAATHTA